MAVNYEKLSEEQEKRILGYVTPFITMNPGLNDHRARLESIDRLIERSYDTLKKKGCKECKKEEPENENVTVPVIGPQLETITAQLAKIFLRTDPPVQMFASPSGSPIANQYNVLYGKYSRKFQWRRNLLLLLQDAVHYNFCAAEVSWKSRAVRELKAETSLTTGSMKSASAFEEGEAIKYLHSYNVIWDGSVPVNEVPHRGAYVGYIQQFTKIALYQFLKDEGIELTAEEKKNLKPTQSSGIAGYYKPEINEVTSNDSAPVSYDKMWEGKKNDKATFTSTELFNLYTLYIRIIPADFGIMSENATEINIMRLYLIGDSFIAGAKLLDNAHNLFPIIFGQIAESTLGLNSFTVAEELEPIQNTATKLYQTEIASARRMIADRAIYDPNLISEKDVNSPSPTAKIRLRQSLSQSVTIQSAYYPIPYEDRAMGARIGQANQLLSFASPIAGTNPAMEGQFIKGNKTAGEFNTIMASAGDRVLTSAIFFDDQFFGPLRTILLADTLQYQSNISVYSKDQGDFIDVDMAQLREQPIDFEIAAGLIPADEMASLDFFQVIMQTLMSRPDLNMEFKSIEALCYLAETKGVKYLTRFMRSAEEKQQMMQQQMAMVQAQAQAENAGQSDGQEGEQ